MSSAPATPGRQDKRRRKPNETNGDDHTGFGPVSHTPRGRPCVLLVTLASSPSLPSSLVTVSNGIFNEKLRKVLVRTLCMDRHPRTLIMVACVLSIGVMNLWELYNVTRMSKQTFGNGENEPATKGDVSPFVRLTSCAIVIVASINDATNMTMVRRNMQQFPGEWNCLWLTGSGRSDLASNRCQVFRREGTTWGEILYQAIETIETYGCDTKLLLLDDVDMSHLNVSELQRWALENQVDIASPLVQNATHVWMRNEKDTGVPFVEIYATLFNLAAWRTFKWLLTLLPTGVGWGYDKCLSKHRTTGILRNQSVLHLQRRTLRQFSARAFAEMYLLQQLCTNSSDRGGARGRKKERTGRREGKKGMGGERDGRRSKGRDTARKSRRKGKPQLSWRRGG